MQIASPNSAGIHASPSHGRKSQIGDVPMHEFKLFVRDCEPRALLDVAGRHLEKHWGLTKLPLGFHPAPICSSGLCR